MIFPCLAVYIVSVIHVVPVAPASEESPGQATFSIRIGNETSSGNVLLSNSSFGEFLTGLLGGDASCSENQLESIANCSFLIMEEFMKLDNETLDFAMMSMAKSGGMFPGAGPPGQGFPSPGGSSLGLRMGNNEGSKGVNPLNQSEAFDFFVKHPNESRALLEATCKGMHKMTECGTEIIGETDCNPLMFRVPKAVSGVICEPDFFDLIRENMDCMAEAVENNEISTCLEELNLTAADAFDANSGEDMDLSGAICDVTAQVFRCFDIKDSQCSRQVLGITTKLTSRIMEAVFGPGNGCDFYNSGSSENVVGEDIQSGSSSKSGSSDQSEGDDSKENQSPEVNTQGDKKTDKDEELVRAKRH